MLHSVMTAALEDVEKTDQIRLDIGMRILESIADPGLRSQIDDPLGPVRGKHSLDFLAVGEVGFYKMKIVLALQPRQTRELQIDVVIVVEVVNADDLVTAGDQRSCGLRADEARDAGNKNLHAIHLPTVAAGQARPAFQNYSRPSLASTGNTCLRS